MTVTRVFPPGAPRSGPNGATLVRTGHTEAVCRPAPVAIRPRFVRRYAQVRAALERHRAQGVLFLLFDGDAVVAEGWLRASVDQTRATIVGRHSRCALRAPSEETEVSLRHLAVLVRAVDHHRTRVRVMDLASPLGFFDEAGRPLRGAAVEGTAFLRVGTLDLWLLTTHPDEPPEADAEDAYRCIPPRVFLDERVGSTPEGPRPRPRTAPGDIERTTPVVSMAGPLSDAPRLCCDDEAPVGRLLLRSGADEIARRVGPSALARGVLVGRYDRCDLGRQATRSLSRVHLLLLQDGDDVLAIDTASTNGTESAGAEIVQTCLRDGDTLVLPGALALAWNRAA